MKIINNNNNKNIKWLAISRVWKADMIEFLRKKFKN